jgi:glutamate decarboxylase
MFVPFPLYNRSTLTKFIDGLTYAGVGWALWRDKSFLPNEILFTVNYLGSPQVSFTLNFSKSGVHVIGQYYQLLRLGKMDSEASWVLCFLSAGCIHLLETVIQMMNLTNTSDWLAQQISEIVDVKGKIKFALLGDNIGGKGLPLVAWHLKEKEDYDGVLI